MLVAAAAELLEDEGVCLTRRGAEPEAAYPGEVAYPLPYFWASSSASMALADLLDAAVVELAIGLARGALLLPEARKDVEMAKLVYPVGRLMT